MKKIMLLTLISLIIAGFIAPPVYCQERENMNYVGTGRGEAMFFDLLFLRPLGIASCAIGFAGTILALPFALSGGNMRETADALLTEPGNYTFIRPLGQID